MELLILLASIVIAVLVLTWLLKVVKTTVTTAVTIAAIVLALQVAFGIGPAQVLNMLGQLPQLVWKLFTGGQ